MELNTQEILNAQFYTLPLAVQDIINENEWKLLIKELASNYRLHQDQTDIVESVTLLTMLGFANSEHFTQNIVEEAKIDSSIANEIGKKINSDVFDILEQVALLVAAEQEEGLDDDSLLILDDARSSDRDVAENLDDLDLSDESDLAAKKLLDEIENPENYLPGETSNKAETQLQNHVDGMIGGKKDDQEASKTQADENPQSEESQNRPATHMRTLKSDIVKAKMQNPSWEPQITKKTDDDVAAITQEALKETQEQARAQNSQADTYREQV